MKIRKKIKIEMYNDHFENAKVYNIPHAQLIIADLPYNLGANAYASNPSWYVGGGTTKMVKANLLENNSLIPMMISE